LLYFTLKNFIKPDILNYANARFEFTTLILQKQKFFDPIET